MKPLTGIRVLDFTQAHAGSFATMILADFGAEVIKIERTGVGDLARYWAPMRDGNSAYYAYLNRGKKSVGLNAAKPEGQEVIRRLLRSVDVVTENFKYGSMERMGFSYDVLRQEKPDIIYASLNGFGQTGPMKNAIGLDLQLQAMSGVMDLTGFPEGSPVKAGAALGDQLSGTYMALAILLALIHHQKTGEGQRVDIAILDALVSALGPAAAISETAGTVCRQGNVSRLYAPSDTFILADGELALSVRTDAQWKTLCGALGLAALGNDPRYETNEQRLAAYEPELKALLASALRNRNLRETELLLRQCQVPCSVVRNVQEAMEISSLAQRMLLTLRDPALGILRMPGVAIRLDETPGAPESAAPALGEHTEYYLRQCGYSTAEIETLIHDRIAQRA